MTDGDRSAVTRYLRRMVSPPHANGLTDAELLERFVGGRDAAAFEVLVWRHGPKVYGVCRRVLRHEQDAEDAFQATFLVLVRKAAAIGRRQAVGPWLYRVAYRVALRAKLRAGRRSAREAPAADVPAAERTPQLIWDDLRPVLDEEVNRLPAKYRAAFILCYLDGKTNEEAARELGCPKGTILSRLAWARERLRVRLTRRGLALSAGLLSAALAADAAAPLPAALVALTLRAVAGAVAPQVAALTKGVLRAMLWTKVKIVMACVLALTVLGVGGVLTRQAGGAKVGAADPPAKVSRPDKAEPLKAEPPPDKAEAPKPQEKRYEINFREAPWKDVFEWYSDLTGLAFSSTFKPWGWFTFITPKGKQYTVPEITDVINEALLANGKQRYVLLVREQTFSLWPADAPIDPTLLPQVKPDELEKRGRTELVAVILPTTAKVKEIVPDVKKMLGPFGDVKPLEKANQLLLYDTAGNLLRVRQMVKDAEQREAKKK